MGIAKSTRIENYRMIHVWTDEEIGFKAEVAKWDHVWMTGDQSRTFDRYQNAVDWVMEEWRLAKTGRESWDALAIEMAGDMGLDWEALSDDEQQDFLNSVRAMARLG